MLSPNYYPRVHISMLWVSVALVCVCRLPLSAIDEANVLVVYNSESADSQAIHDYYLGVRPNVLSFDLNDATLVTPTISYADFGIKIRDPIRSHLAINGLEETVWVIVLTKDIPHRIQSLNTSAPNSGDNGSATTTVYHNGNANFASVDSELTLLHFDLEMGENGGDMDSVADRAVINPYFDSTMRFNSFSRSDIDSNNLSFSERSLPNYGSWWQLDLRLGQIFSTPADAGNIYLTARLDADTVDDVKAIIDRAQQIAFRKQFDAIILDADSRSERLDSYFDPNTFQTKDDYTAAADLVEGDWTRVFADETDSFLTGLADPISLASTTRINGPVAHLHSYGVNHNGNNSQIRDYLTTFQLQLPPGASFSAYESFGAVGLGGLGNKGQAQVEEWISAGGTFATGPAWEPFTFGIMRSEVFLDRFMNDGFTYVEAAWAAILQLSWQTVVIGDPLATASFQEASPYEEWTFAQAGNTAYADTQLEFDADFDFDSLSNGYEFVLGLDPSVSNASSDRLLEFDYTLSGQTLFLTLDAANAAQSSIHLETNDNLLSGSWSMIATRDPDTGWSGDASVTETPSGDDLDITISDPTASDGKRFYRLSVTENSL